MNKLLSVPDACDGERLDRFLTTVLPEHSRSWLQHLILAHKITGTRPLDKPRLAVRAGETICIELPDPDQRLVPVPGELPILFEDDRIIVVDKPASLQVHPLSLENGSSIVQILLYMRPELIAATYDPASEISRLRPGIVHRLDKDTTGVLVVAKTHDALEELADQFRTRQVHKRYETLLSGALLHEKTVDAALQRKPGRENMMGVARNPEEGREAISHFVPLAGFLLPDGLPVTYVSCRIETGRTHQIRAHAKSMGMPVLGDARYVNRPSEAISKRLGISRQLLHAKELTFLHDGKPLTVTSPLPPDFQAALQGLQRTASQGFDNGSTGVIT